MSATELQEMIRSGRLPAGTKVHHRGRESSGRSGLEATVVEDGIKFEGRVYRTPSAAAKSVTGAPVDGWNFWRMPDGRQLADLR